MTQEVRWERMFPDQLEAAFAKKPLVWFSYGLCEPHGPQNALGLDTLKAHALCCEAARTHGGIVAPPDYWHIHELGRYAVWAAKSIGECRPWLTAVPPWVHFRNVLYHIRAADALGFHAAVLVTGHYGPNWQDLKTLLEFWQPHFAMQLFGLPDFEAHPEGKGDHAGYVETSQLWSLEPDCVDISRIPKPLVPGQHFAMGPDAPNATRREGERIVQHQVEWLGKKADELLARFKTPAGERKAVTFAQTEEIWAETMRTRLKDLLSMADLNADDKPPEESSRWRANWKVPSV